MRRLMGLVVATAAVMASLLVPALAAANSEVAYVKATGHNVQGAFLEFWETNGGPDIFGYPITEEMPSGGMTVQYFQRARFEFRNGKVELGNLGDELGKSQAGQPNPRSAATGTDWQYFSETKHLVSGGFLRQFKGFGGAAVYGYPISAELTENGRTVQYFQKARMEWTGSSVELGLLGEDVVKLRSISTEPVEKNATVADWTPRVRQQANVGAAGGPGPSKAVGKSIVISLERQQLWAYQDGALVLTTPVTTGAPGTPTLPGDFNVMSKHTPFLFVSPWPLGDPNYYESAWTTYSMLYADGGYYIHDAPWRMDYGPGTTTWHRGSDGQWRQGSHGCINVPFAAMEALFKWSDRTTSLKVI